MEGAIPGFGLDGHFARIGELNRVADEIDQDLGQAATVAVAWRQVGSQLKLERELFVGRQRLKRAANRLGYVLNAVIGKFEDELAGFDLGEIEHVIDQTEQMFAVGLKAFEYAEHLLGRLAIRAVRHQFGVTQDRVERRAQLMAHVGQELRLVLARFFQLSALVLDFIEQAHVLDGDRRLICKRRDQLDLLIGEWSYFRSCQNQDADWDAFAQHWDAKNCAEIAQSWRFDEGVFRISLYVGNVNHATFDQRAP